MSIERAAATANFTLNNTGTAALITGLTLTPASGDYFLHATIEFITPAAAIQQTDIFSVWVNDVEIPHSRRTYFANSSIDNMSATYVLTCKVSPTGSQDVEIRHTVDTAASPNIASNRELTLFSMPTSGTNYEDSSTTNDTTVSATWDVIVGMTRTPVTGDYLVVFSSTVTGPSASTDCGFRIRVGGTVQTHTLREVFFESSGNDQEWNVMLCASITANGSQAVDVQFNRSAGSATVTCHDRTMNLIPVDSTDIFQATGTADDTDSTTTDKLLDDMTITDPGADDYMTMFSMTQAFGALGGADLGRVTYSIHEGGAVVVDSERNNEIEDSLDGTHLPTACGGKVTVGGSTDDLEIFWQGASTTARTGRERTFIAMREGGAAWEQEGYRWRNDDGSESAASFRQLQDVVDVVDKEDNIRLRTLLDSTGDPGSLTRTLQYKLDTDPDAEYRTI